MFVMARAEFEARLQNERKLEKKFALMLVMHLAIQALSLAS